MQLGGVVALGNGVTIGCTSTITKNKIGLVTGLQVEKNGLFKARLDLDGTLEMMTRIRANKWVTVALSSATSVKTRFDPVAFAWSLDFDVPESIKLRAPRW
jgi:hypothetical protein